MNLTDLWTYLISGGAGFGLSQLYDSYVKSKRDKRESESDVLRTANESRDRDLAFIKEHDDSVREFRDELRIEIELLRSRVGALEEEIKLTNQKYYALLDEHITHKANYKGLEDKYNSINAKYQEAQGEIEELRKDMKKHE
jgi:chromosome segregation ATPase